MKINTKQRMENQLWNPNPDARGYTRWWWFGCAVTEEEISRELDLMKDAQIGGVEVQILYPVVADDENKGIKNQQYLSPEFLYYIKFACEEAKKRSMEFDFTLGSSWPYGGPFVTEEYSAPNIIPYTMDIKGPCKFKYDLTTRLYGECVACVMGKMEECEMIPETILDITDKVIDKYLFNWEWGKELLEIEIPEGNYKIVFFIVSDKKQMVLKPLGGGDGMIIDHNRKEATQMFLTHAGNPIAKEIEGMVRTYFCDSIEVFGQNWSPIVYEEFEARRGYSLKPYVYALWGEIRGITDQIRYDFHKTMSELTVENFFQELTKWCHEKGAKSRIQAHGTWGDILQAYGAADIPEGETFSAFDRYEVNTVHRKLATSAGHIYQKPIISNESFTWLRFPRFIVTLEQMKAAVDSIFLDGVNHIINHGYAYSPEGSGQLGWPFYASTQINHTNTWWPYYKHLGAYINRVCDFMQRGKTKIKVAVYLPQADIWAENPLSDIHMCMKLEERLSTKNVDRLHKSGYWFDFVNDDGVRNWADYEYEVLIFLECDRIEEEIANKVFEIASEGTRIICKGKSPSMSCGYQDYEEKTQSICKTFTELVETNQCVVADNDIESVINVLERCVKKDLIIEHHKNEIGYVHQVDKDVEIYFVSNVSQEWKEEKLTFIGQSQHFSVYDPMTSKEKELISVTDKNGDQEVCVKFEPFQALLFVFSKEMGEERLLEEGKDRSVLLNLSNDWVLEVQEKGFAREYDTLESWEKEERLRYYSGEGIYRSQFKVDEKVYARIQKSVNVELNFENIGETATVYVNNQEVGVILKHPHTINVKEYIISGENIVEVRVSNLLINCAINPDYPEGDYAEVIEEWPYTTGRLNAGRQERVFNWRENKMIKEPLQSGIWGTVELIVVEG